MTNVETQTETFHLYPSQPLHRSDPYEMFNPFPSNLQYLTPRMPIPGNISPAATYSFPPNWSYNAIPNVYKPPLYSALDGSVNGHSDEGAGDPLENFNPHDTDEPAIERRSSGEMAAEPRSPVNGSGSEYSLFPDAEPLCSPKTSHFLGDKDDGVFGRGHLREADHRSYATALKDHIDGPESLPDSFHSDPTLSPGVRSRSSSTASASNNLSRSASSADNHHPPLSPTRECAGSPTHHRPYAGVDDIDPKSHVLKNVVAGAAATPTFAFFYERLPDSVEYLDATSGRPVKAGWRPLAGKHEKTRRRLDFKPQYVDEKGRMRHGVRVRGALKSMECWLHTNNKPPVDCLFAHSRIGDTLQFICVRCTVEKARNYECREKKGHAAFFCNLGPYRDVNGDKWRGQMD